MKPKVDLFQIVIIVVVLYLAYLVLSSKESPQIYEDLKKEIIEQKEEFVEKFKVQEIALEKLDKNDFDILTKQDEVIEAVLLNNAGINEIITYQNILMTSTNNTNNNVKQILFILTKSSKQSQKK